MGKRLTASVKSVSELKNKRDCPTGNQVVISGCPPEVLVVHKAKKKIVWLSSTARPYFFDPPLIFFYFYFFFLISDHFKSWTCLYISQNSNLFRFLIRSDSVFHLHFYSVLHKRDPYDSSSTSYILISVYQELCNLYCAIKWLGCIKCTLKIFIKNCSMKKIIFFKKFYFNFFLIVCNIFIYL